MKLNELSPAAGSVKEAYRKGRSEGPLRRRHPHRI